MFDKLFADEHGILFFVGWAVVAPIATFIARFLKAKLGHKWYFLHRGLMGGVLSVLVIIAFALGVAAVSQRQSPHFDGGHQILGLLIFILIWFQAVLGAIINRLWRPERTKVPIHDKVHWWLGRILILAGTNTLS